MQALSGGGLSANRDVPPSRYLALPYLEIDGRKAARNSQDSSDPLMDDLMEDIIQIAAEESLHRPSKFTLVVKNDYFPGRDRDRPWRYQELLEIGKPVKIGFQASTTAHQDFEHPHQDLILEGEITGIETHFTDQSQAPIIVHGYDVSHRLHRGRYNRSFQNMTDKDIVKKIVEEVGIPVGTLDNTGSPHDYVFQENQTNMAFLRERAARLGFELFMHDGKLHFRKPKAGSEIELKWLKDLHSFRVRVTSAEQVSSVEVRGWDYSEKKPIVETAPKPQASNLITQTENGKGKETSTLFNLNRNPPKMVVVDQPIFQGKEAEAIANALFNELSGEFVYADAKGEGDPRIRPGKVVKVADMGLHSGKYYVTETRHLYYERFYTTEFSVRGSRLGSLLDVVSPQHPLQPGQTLMVGIVTDNKDPKGWGRVKVKFPTLTEEHASNWARVVALGAGSQRGFDCLPEINDEVLVAFEHGDIHRPYVLGGVWNGKDAPPASINDTIQSGQVRLRTLKTRTGHTLQFVEEDKGNSKDGIYVQTSGGHKLRLNDSDRTIEVETANGHKLTLSDMNQNITLKSTGSINIQAATTLEIKANGTITVKGSMIFLN